MIHLFINGLAASAGGGLTYLRNVVPELARRGNVGATVLLNPALSGELAELTNISFITGPGSSGALTRLFFEQNTLPGMIRRSRADALVSTGNFALWRSPVPQILLSRNSLYTSTAFVRDVRDRGDYALWLDTLIKGSLARQSINCAEVTVAPSQSFAKELSAWTGKKVVAIHHGFDTEGFFHDQAPLPSDVRTQVEDGDGALRLLFVSHYNYYRNFETLLRAVPLLNRRLRGRKAKLYLTCCFREQDNPGSYKTSSASSLLQEVRRNGDIVELGSVPYHSLHHLYRACHIYVTPAYAESFAHPLVEAMSCGLPVVASDLPVHLEVCQTAAVYFPRFSPEELANAILRVVEDEPLKESMAKAGRLRAKDFSWKSHVDQLLALAEELVQKHH